MASEKFCLKWNDYESNLGKSFDEIRNGKDFFDVTLVCEDTQIEAHKLILGACSIFFKNVLRFDTNSKKCLGQDYIITCLLEELTTIILCCI